MTDEALIIFAKNAVQGKVKTRLASHLGTIPTLSFYKKLLSICSKETTNSPFDKFLYYSDYIEKDDCFPDNTFNKKLQIQEGNLGIKMKHAIDQTFNLGYSKCIIIGSDCPYIDSNMIKKAFRKLNDNDAVIGPALDGGFYLFGVNNKSNILFDDIIWSSNKVTNTLIQNLKSNNLKFKFLTFLDDIDNINSYNKFIKTSKMYE